jgi:DNA-binding SARP family transcriptional activator/energy-coupling factor transporter ATP-binding protein EcfA2
MMPVSSFRATAVTEGPGRIGSESEASMGKTSAALQAAEVTLDIRLFGRASVSAGGVPVKFAKRATTLAMLALILLQRGQTISRESLAFTLFPEADETSALAELRRYLYLANKSLPASPDDPWLIVDSETVRWNTAGDAFVDIIAFERLAANAETQSEAIEMYGGDLLEEIYDDWVVGERERLRARYLAIASESLERYRTGRAFAAAIACAKRILASDPWREDTLRALLAVRYESGDSAGALAEYELFAKRLRDELAIAPMPETSAVRQAILRNEALPGSLDLRPHADQRGAQRAIAILPFVGRRRELAALHAIWRRAARGAGALVLLTGEAGVGKTRLTAELARTVQAEGGRVFVGTTSPSEAMPYQPIVEALRSGLPLLLARPPVAARRAALARVLPELSDPDAPDIVLPEQAPELETARIYDALSHAVRGLASPRPLLLVLEDVHWAGPATVEALGAIVRNVTRAPVLVIASCREEETPADHPLRALLRTLRPFHNVEELSLERLLQDDVADLVASVDDLRERGETLVRDLFAHSEGNALFLNEAISGVLERGEAPSDALATTIEHVLAARIARLGEDAHTVAQIAAVAGPGCSVALVREVSNIPVAAVARGFDELLERRIVREAGARAKYDYAFTHHLIAKAVYDGIEPAFRAQRHSRIARVLETEYRPIAGGPAREIARHHERAGETLECADWYLTAARQAAAVHAYGDAIELATRALEYAASPQSRQAALDVRERARGRRGDRSGQRADIDELERLAGADPRSRFDVILRRVLLARTLGASDDEGRAIAEMEVLARSLDDAARAQALAERATHAGLRSRQADGLEPARAALAIYERLGDVRGQLECLYLLVDFTANIGDIEASRRYLALMSERAGSLADQVVEARALSVASTAALLRRDYRESFDLATRALVLHEATNDREGEAWALGRLAVNAAWLGDFGTALREFDRALVAFESIGNQRGLALTHTNRTTLLMRLGLFRDALASIERSNALYEIAHEQRTITANLVNASFVTLHLGDAPEAKELAHRALTAAKEIAFPVFEAAALSNLGNAERVLGQLADAIEHMEAGIAIRRPIQEPRDFVDDLADLTLSYVAAGRTRDALATAEELCAIGRVSFDGAFWPHYIWWAIAQGLAAGGESARAKDAAERARTELETLVDGIDDERTRASLLAIDVNARIAGRS